MISRLGPLQKTVGTAPPLSGRMRVLYVEDDQDNWEALSWVLAKDFEMVRATHAQEAFELLRTQDFDVALIDVQLAGSEFSGFDIARLMHGTYAGKVPAYAENVRCPNLRVVFLTGDDHVLRTSGEAVLMKPVEIRELRQALRSTSPDSVKGA